MANPSSPRRASPPLCTLLLCLLGGCRSTPATVASGLHPPPPSPAQVRRVVDDYVQTLFTDNPSFARWAGLHQHDGRIPPLGEAAASAQVTRATAVLDALQRVEATRLADPLRLEVELIRLHAQQTVFHLAERAEHHRILFYTDLFDISGYLARDYAPLPQRVEALVTHLEAASDATEAILATLDAQQSREHLITARIEFEGLLEQLDKYAPALAAGALINNVALSHRFNAARDRAESRLRRLLSWVDGAQARATLDHRLGEHGLLRLLEVREGLRTDVASLRRMVDADFQRNHAALQAVAARIAPERTLADAVARTPGERMGAETLLQAAQDQLDALHTFVTEHDLVTLPDHVPVTVAVPPPLLRSGQPFLEPVGPLEPLDALFFYVTPPDPAWPRDRQDAHLPAWEEMMLTAIHQVYPGHHVHGLHLNRLSSRSRVAALLTSPAFVEGWAHYMEQVMLDEGFMPHRDQVKVVQLHRALVRDCRFLAVLGVHVDGMTVEAATRLFRERCLLDEPHAQQQAVRATHDPGFLSDTLGKLQILALRQRYLAKHPGARLVDFHDWLLRFGGAPLALVEKRL